jgi:hypothetical protein
MNVFIPEPTSLYTRTVFNKSKGYKNKRKTQNPIAVAHQKRGGAGCGFHKDKKKEQNRRACRGKIRADIF